MQLFDLQRQCVAVGYVCAVFAYAFSRWCLSWMHAFWQRILHWNKLKLNVRSHINTGCKKDNDRIGWYYTGNLKSSVCPTSNL